MGMVVNKTRFSNNPHWAAALNERAKLLFGADWEYNPSLIESKQSPAAPYLRIRIGSKTLYWDLHSSPGRLTLWSGYGKYEKSDPSSSVPSMLRIDKDGVITLRINYLKDGYHDPSSGIPAYQLFNADGTLSKTVHYKNGLAQDPDDHTPAEVYYYETGVLKEMRWRQNGSGEDNKFGIPSSVTYTKDGDISVGYSSAHGMLSKKRTEEMIAMAKQRFLSSLVGESQVVALSSKSHHQLTTSGTKFVSK